jgi:hypothetical protein
MQRQETSAVKTVAPVYLVREGELLLAAPLKEAWSHIIDYQSWQNYTSVERISGEEGQAGEVVLLRKDEGGFKFPPYYSRIITINPESRVIWKTWPQENPDAFFGIVDFRVYPAGERTRFAWSVLYEFMVPHTDAEELKAFEAAQSANFQALFDSVLPMLEQQVRSAAVSSRV